ncbi:MAG TPA: glycosyltransferase [Microlunatus sp.]|nr:glycosyltransferase [Microlunatus sp.]
MSLARVACVIPARDAADRIQATVTAARALPGVDVVIVTDDGSSDPTGDYAAASGAIVVTHQRGRGRAAAIESGVNALGVLEQRDKRPECGTVLVLDADLGASAARAQHLIGPVVTERADLTIAIPVRPAAGTPEPGFDLVETTAARGVSELAGWTPRAPLATNRCLTRRAYELASPLAAGDGADVGMTIDLLRAGLRVQEIEVDLDGPDEPSGLAARLDRALVLKDVTRALTARGLVRHSLDELKQSGGVAGLIDKFRG